MRVSVAVFQLFKRTSKVNSWKGGKLHRLVTYLGSILNDYKTVAKETLTDMRDHPVKGGFYVTSLAALCGLLRTNPNNRDFTTTLYDSSNELSLLGESVRNPTCESHVNTLLRAHKDGCLKYTNFLFCSLMWIDDFGPSVRLYEARCKHLKVGWRNFHSRIVDIGAANHWWSVERSMQDYDVNPTEWGDKVQIRTFLFQNISGDN